MGVVYGRRNTVNATGGTETEITQNGKKYRVHTFTSVGSSTFTVLRGGEVEYLVVAGGGGGGGGTPNNHGGGGGGAGGLLNGTKVIPANAYSIVVGAGGLGADKANAIAGNNGENSSAISEVAIGGGRGGTAYPNLNSNLNNIAQSGGSGGGGGASNTESERLPGLGTLGQGNDGGRSAVGAFPRQGASGGGAGLKGVDSIDPAATAILPGGDGLVLAISGTAIEYSKGGNGGTNIPATPPPAAGANRGLGGTGGNGRNEQPGANGGSGIVIIRYRIG